MGNQVQEGNEQTTPDLDSIMTDGRANFTGDVAPDSGLDDPGPAKDEDLLIGAPGGDLVPPSDTPPEAQTEAPVSQPAAQIPAALQDAASPPLETQEAPAQPPKPLRFKSHDEAEKGYQHLQREKTLADQKVQALTEELQRRKMQEQSAREQEAEEQAFVDFAQGRNEQALKEIDELDPDDPEYRKKAAAAWTRANKDIRFWQKNKTETAVPPADATRPATAPPTPAQTDPAPAITYVHEKLAAAGIPKDDLLFWKIARDAPATDPQGQPLDFDAQIAWALAETKTYRDSLMGPGNVSPAAAALAERRTKEAQARDLPLGRSPADRASVAEPPTPISMADAIHFAQEKRRL